MRHIYSGVLIALALSGILVVPGLTASINSTHAQQPNPTSDLPSGLPNYASLVARGNYFVTLVQSSSEYRSLSHGTAFYADPHTSFGFSSGPNKQDDYEIITLFSSNREAYIQADVNNTTSAIIDMSFTNLTSAAEPFA